MLLCTTAFCSVSKYKVIQLIGDLNGSPESNGRAVRELREIGSDAAPYLVSEIQKFVSLEPSDLISAARCLRALKEIDSNAGIAVGAKSLRVLAPKPKVFESNERVMLAEAISYLSSQANSREASKALLTFILNEAARYEDGTTSYFLVSRLENVPSHEKPDTKYIDGWVTSLHVEKKIGSQYFRWNSFGSGGGGGRRSQTCDRWIRRLSGPGYTLLVDVYVALQALAEHKVPGTETVLLDFLQRHPYQITLYLERLGPDGFTPSVLAIKENSSAERDWIDKRGRPRIALIKLLMKGGTRGTISSLEKMLLSKHEDERQQALITIEGITESVSTIGNGVQITSPAGIAIGTSEISEDDKYDKITMRNGDAISGQVMNASLDLRASYAELKIQTSTVKHIKLEGADSKTDSVELRNGDRLTGSLNDKILTVNLRAGETIAISKKDIASIDFRRVWSENDVRE
jgi:hypothetical protein